MTYSAEVLADSPVGYWRLGDSSGLTAADSSGNSHPGTYDSGPTLGVPGLLAGDADTAVSFDGADDFVDLSNPAALQLASAWTLEAWIKIASGETSAGVVIAQRYDGSHVPFVLSFWNGTSHSLKPSVNFYNGTWRTAQSSSSITVNAIHHLVGTWDGTTLRIYVDGSEVANNTPGSSPTATPQTVRIGSRWDNGGDGQRFKGVIDDAAIYSTALSSARVAAHYAAAAVVDGTATPSATAGVGAVPSPTSSGTALASPATGAGIGSVPAPSASGSFTALPAAVAGIGAVPASSAFVVVNGTALPAVVVGTGRVPHPIAEGQSTGGGGGSVDGVNDFWVIEALG